MAKTINPELVSIYYDETDPRNPGWAYNVRTADGDTSGPLTSRRRDAGLLGLLRQLRREFRSGSVALPGATKFRQVAGGWEAR